MGAKIDSVGVNNPQTGPNNISEVLPIFELPLSPTGGSFSTKIDTTQNVFSASSPHQVQKSPF